jgi:hypothetical protein
MFDRSVTVRICFHRETLSPRTSLRHQRTGISKYSAFFGSFSAAPQMLNRWWIEKGAAIMFRKLRMNFTLLVSLAWLLTAFTPAEARQLAQHPHGHDCASAAEISLNSDVNATLLDTSDYAFYKIVLDQRGVLDVWIDPGVMDAWDMELRNSSCQVEPGAVGDESLLTRKWAGITVPHKGRFSWDPSAWTLDAGVYFVRIRRNPVRVFQDSFTFHTKFIPHYGHECITAEPIQLPGAIEGELLYAEDREVFRVTITHAGPIHAWTTGPLTTPKQPVLEVSAADCCSRPPLQISVGQTGIVTTALTPGEYYVAVKPWRPEYVGRFTFHVDFGGVFPITSALPH